MVPVDWKVSLRQGVVRDIMTNVLRIAVRSIAGLLEEVGTYSQILTNTMHNVCHGLNYYFNQLNIP